MRFWVVTVVSLFFLSALFYRFGFEKETIKVGLIYSDTGVMASSEKSVAVMFKAAIQQINDNGGLLSKPVEIIEYKTDSSSVDFKKGAEALVKAGVVSIFGSWTSGSRKQVKSVVEDNNNLLFYPAQYEGFEESKNVIYLGLSANQQINPTLFYIQKYYGNNIYLVGSNYIYPRTANHYIEELANLTQFNVVGQRYVSFYEPSFGDLFSDIVSKQPDAIISTINGSTNVSFFAELQKYGIKSANIPVFSLSLDGSLLAKNFESISPDSMVGHYATWGYFNNKNPERGSDFLQLVERYLEDGVDITDTMFSVYLGVKMFQKAVVRGNSASTSDIMANIKRESYHLSGSTYFLDPVTNHLYRHALIGKINDQNRFDVVWQTPEMIKPHPFPSFKAKSEWESFLKTLVDKPYEIKTGETGALR